MDAPPLPGAPLPGSPAATGPSDDLRRIAEEFESVFIAQMLAPMFQGIETDGLGGGGIGEEMFRPMLIEQYAGAIAQAGGIGLADHVVREFMRMQAAPPETAANGE
jgi:Rod binding domain-containing protein